jgi:hypothetical protein
LIRHIGHDQLETLDHEPVAARQIVVDKNVIAVAS